MVRGFLGILLVALTPRLAAAEPVTLSEPGITIEPTAPVALALANTITVTIDGNPVGFGVDIGQGTCAYDNALVAIKLGQGAVQDTIPAGYWGPVFKSADALYLCADLKDGFVSIIVSPPVMSPAVEAMLVELRRGAIEAHGAPIGNRYGAIVTLPRTQQEVTLPGLWKVVDGERWKVAGDVIVSTSNLGSGSSTMHAVGVSEGPCTPGMTPFPAVDAQSLFPEQLGSVWLDDDPYKLRWRASACITKDGASATVSVLAPLAGDAPDWNERAQLRELVIAVARSYGVEIPVPGGGGGGGGSSDREGKASGHFLLYGGVIGITPEGGERAFGGLVGGTLRMAKPGGGIAAAMDMELGYGDGEFLGEIRAGGGFAVGSRRAMLDALAGISVGSTGPAAALDGYVEAGLGIHGKASLLWVGAMQTWGVGGPGHQRAELRLGIPNKEDQLVVLGVRYLRFGDDDETMMGNGDAILVTFGWGIAKLN